MPKKTPKNAFFYFMIDFRDDQKKKGTNYANMTEVQQAADPVWRASHPSVRAKYEKIAKDEKTRHNVPIEKFTTTGIPISEIVKRERLIKEAAQRELKDIQNFVQQNTINGKIINEHIYIIDVNALCETNGERYVFGEMAVLRFNINDGIIDHLHEIINPPHIPVGYASDIKRGCEELGLDFPDSEAPRTDYMKTLSNIVDYLKQGDKSTKVMPPLYTMPEKVDQVLDFIGQLCHRAHEDETLFRVYQLDTLFFYVINVLRNRSDEGLPKESLARAALKKDVFKYTPGICCEHHDNVDRSTECTKARVQRWAFTVLDGCCPLAGVEPVPGHHVPANIDIEAVLQFKEDKKKSQARFAGKANSAWQLGSDDSFSAAEPHAHTRPPARSLQPIRKPTVATLNFQKLELTAPELSENNFPPLNLGSGRGSGCNKNWSSSK